MSVGSKSLPARRAKDDGGAGENGDGGAVVRREQEVGDFRASRGGGSMRRSRTAARYDRCLPGMELRIGPGPLKDVDAEKLKGQIRRWAKAVVAFARQISFGGSPRSAASTPTTSGAGDTPRSPTLTASRSSTTRLGVGGAKNQQPPA
ncbi:hypothetical protein BS78_03G180900 [Paspalum vaginatum]|nr:hypothetical protein BS78_03G180900 [Paspalum vaginatum]